MVCSTEYGIGRNVFCLLCLEADRSQLQQFHEHTTVCSGWTRMIALFDTSS